MLSIVWNWKSRRKLSTIFKNFLKLLLIWVCIFVTNILEKLYLIEKLNLYAYKILLFYKIIYKYVEENQLQGKKRNMVVDQEISVQDSTR